MEIICTLLDFYVLVVLVRIIASWFPMDPSSGFAGVIRVLDTVIEPVLGPLRRALPPVRAGTMALDLSPIVLLLGVRIVQALIGC